MSKRQKLSRFSSAILSALSMSLLAANFLPGALPSAHAAGKPNQTQEYRTKALQEAASGRDQAALESYKLAINAARAQYGSESTYLSELYFEMGNLARSKGQSEAARDCYRNAVRYRPNDVPARLQLAELERNTKNVGAAFEEIKKASETENRRAFSGGKTSLSSKEMMLCMQSCGRPAEAAKIAFQLQHGGKASAFTKGAIKLPASAPAAPGEPSAVTAAVSVTPNSALHWAPGLRKKADEEAAAKKKADEAAVKKVKDQQANEDARRKQAEAALQKAEQEKKARDRAKEDKSRSKSKKDDAKKPAAKGKPATAPAFVEQPVNNASLKTTAKTIKADKSEKAEKTDEKPAPKGHLGVGAVTEKAEKVEKPVEEKGSSVSENEPAKPKEAPPEKVQPAAVQQAIPIMSIDGGKKSKTPHLGKSGLVPPPPPTPVFPTFLPPQGMPPQQVAPAKPKPKPPKPKPVEKEPEKEAEETQAAPGKGSGDGGDFLINWGGDSSAKRKHK